MLIVCEGPLIQQPPTIFNAMASFMENNIFMDRYRYN